MGESVALRCGNMWQQTTDSRPHEGLYTPEAHALRNLDRMDASLLDQYMSTTEEGLHLLAGPMEPDSNEPTPGELARLFDFLANHYRFVIVDASSQLDRTTKLLYCGNTH
jgi:Flp pilus assembly CpaE family ATPase